MISRVIVVRDCFLLLSRDSCLIFLLVGFMVILMLVVSSLLGVVNVRLLVLFGNKIGNILLKVVWVLLKVVVKMFCILLLILLMIVSRFVWVVVRLVSCLVRNLWCCLSVVNFFRVSGLMWLSWVSLCLVEVSCDCCWLWLYGVLRVVFFGVLCLLLGLLFEILEVDVEIFGESLMRWMLVGIGILGLYFVISIFLLSLSFLVVCFSSDERCSFFL